MSIWKTAGSPRFAIVALCANFVFKFAVAIFGFNADKLHGCRASIRMT